MAETCSWTTREGVVLVFPCSGGSDVGELADRGARKLSQAGTAQMYCLAGIGARERDPQDHEGRRPPLGGGWVFYGLRE
jgi:uncharacterized metal-binding protein